MRLRLFVLVPILSLVAAAWVTSPARAQTDYFFQPAGAADYNVDANWLEPNLQNSFVPDGSLNERGIINSGGTAVVSSGGVPSPGAITLGSTAAGTGTLEIGSTGTLAVTAGSLTSGTIAVGTTGSGTVRVLAGGTLSATGALTTGTNSTDVVIVGQSAGALLPAATLSVPSAVLNGSTQVFPNAAFSTTNNVVFGNSSVYTAEVNTSGTGQINAGNAAVLNGTARLNFTGVTPTLGGATFTILEANTFGGTAFDGFTSNASVPFNQVLVPTTVDVAGNRQQLRVGLEESIVLEVNRNTGAAKFTHPGSTSIALDSYFIGSAAGSLNPASFNGLDDQNLLGGNWLETSLTVNNIAELKPTTTASYAAGTQISLGNIYNAFSGGFGGASEEDLQFSFSRFSDGAVIPAVIKYTGTAVNNLLLQVDPTGAGDAFLRNTSQTTVQIDSYHVLSPGSRLSPTAWNSFDEQNEGGANVWLEALNNNATRISEFNQAGFLELAPGEIFNLGKLYLGGAQDLDFQFLMMGQDVGTTGRVFYEAFAPVAGDYNGNGIVDAADYSIWRDTLGSTTDLRANGDNAGASAGKIDAADYAFWKSRFGNTSGSGSGGIGGASQVPEPASWMLVLLAFGMLMVVRRGKQ